jgi:hypothetical protein
MKRIALLVMVSCSFAAVAQQPETVLQLDSLIGKLHHVIGEQKSIEVEEIKGVYRLTAWHFVPSLNYDFISNNYYVTVSSAPLVQNMIGKRQERRRLSAIDRRYDNIGRTSEIRLKNLYLQINQRLANIELSHTILMNDVEIFKIRRQDHENHEIDTEAFLTAKSSILTKIRSHNQEVADIQRFMLEMEQLTEENIELDLSRFFVSPQSITLNSLNSSNSLTP